MRRHSCQSGGRAQAGGGLSPRGWPLSLRRLACVLLLAALMLPGCRGCGQTDDKSKAEKTTLEEELARREKLKKKKKKKPDFEVGDLETVPSDDSELSNFVKPGHFVSARVPAIANAYDFRGDFETAAVNTRSQPILVEGTQYYVTMSRPAALPKGQPRQFSSTFFVPRASSGRGRQPVFLQHELRAARGGQVIKKASQLTRPMPAHQYLMLVLATNPNAYSYLKQLPSVRAPYDAMTSEGEQVVYYRVLLPPLQQPLVLPTHPFAWTTTAVLIWDGIAPDQLSAGQQQALLDWLHWGGQLIISGPGTLDLLGDGFLAPYLPATWDGMQPVRAEDTAELNQHWSLPGGRDQQRAALRVLADKPLTGIRLKLSAPGALVPGTGRLVAERRVGRGRIVVTAFALTSREILNWSSFDSFFNGCLLRRPPRRFAIDEFGSPRLTWASFPGRLRDPLLVTGLRYFSRDAGLGPASGSGDRPPGPAEPGGWRADAQSGVGGWDDQSGVATTVHRTLREAAGIKVPEARFVIASLIVYLVVLVPLNWTVFRLLGRVEWAWGAAPVIAIVGALIVVKMAQLDIGFARSRIEIGVIEVQGAYRRAHASRYGALYTSLSTGYTFRFEDPSAVAFPFPPTPSPARAWPIELRRDRGIELSGFQVDSNATAFMHAEQMLDLQGTFRVQRPADRAGGWELVNDTDFALTDAGVLYRNAAGSVRTGWLGAVAARSTAPLAFTPAEANRPWFSAWYELNQRGRPSGQRVDLQPLFELAALRLALQPGEMRLVGWTRQIVPGMQVRPEASQRQTYTLLLVHLQYGGLPRPRPDENLLVDARRSWEEAMPEPQETPGAEQPQ